VLPKIWKPKTGEPGEKANSLKLSKVWIYYVKFVELICQDTLNSGDVQMKKLPTLLFFQVK